MSDVGLYVHVPFCSIKCGYCDFYSIVPVASDIEPLVDALCRELAQCLKAGNIRVETIFVGGGTPTFLTGALLEKLFAPLGALARTHGVTEFTVEANPGSLNEDTLQILRAAEVDRISMGAQSFDVGELKTLERSHRPEQIATGVERIRRAGFAHLNLDLIFGIPGQTTHSWRHSLNQAITLEPDHLACYGLTYEPGTPMHARRDQGSVEPVPEKQEARFYTTAVETLTRAGYVQYEISNFARPGGLCRHNLRYWHNLPTLGVGPAAVSYLEGCRRRNVPDVASYVRAIQTGTSPTVEQECLSSLQRAGETAMLMLRTVEGIDREHFREATGFDPNALFAQAIHDHASQGLLTADDRRIALTDKGRLLADGILSDFVVPAPH